ncbi:MAG: HD domain-containing protein, partial [Candidatus Gracilibacteria bacterium]|nr:HD domain-containing protein [Candidatus Gracilibacteria bacterium]
MYSLTDATDLLIKSEKLGNPKNIESIRKYNSHKVRHTIGVLEVGRHIIIKYKENNEISDDLTNKSEICFILHDLGRLYQNNTDKILSNEEFDHGDKSAEISAENGYSKSIVLAIKYHN